MMLHSNYVQSTFFVLLLATLLVLGPKTAQSGVVTWHTIEQDDVEREVGTIVLHGIISKGDSGSISDAIKEANHAGILIVGITLISPGGDVEEGLTIGRLIREKRLITSAPSREDFGLQAFQCRKQVLPQAHPANLFIDLLPGTDACVCASACALSWIGGVIRDETVGLHHHFLSEGVESFDQYDQSLGNWSAEIESYLQKVRAPDIFESTWFQTVSSNLTWLGTDTSQEMFEFDPVFREYIISHCGAFPPKAAQSFKSKQAHRYENGKMDEGEAYSYALLIQTLEFHQTCTYDAVVGAILEKQDIHNENAN